MNSRLSILLLGLGLSACASEAVRNAAPPIEDLADRDSPDAAVLPILASSPTENDPQKALDNYRKLLDLQPDAETKTESARRLADLQVQLEDGKGAENGGDEKSLKSSIKLYNQLLYSRPDDSGNDRIFYQLARAYQNVGDLDAAIETLERLQQRHPNSDLIGDAHFRRAELLFSRKRFSEAELEYKAVMDLADRTPFYETAQYKLGWTRFKQAKFESALDLFLSILTRELPRGEWTDVDDALKGANKSKQDLARDSLRVVSLSFVALGGGPAINNHLQRKGDPRFYPLLYVAVAEQQLEQRRPADAAATYAAFIQRYPTHARAPAFQSRVIRSYAEGGQNEKVVLEKERYVTAYDPSASYWSGRAASPEVLTELRTHLDDLAKHSQAAAQRDTSGNRAAAFLTAARWNRRILQIFPKDPKNAETHFLLAQNLFDGGQTLEAAQEYEKTAALYPRSPKAAEAAYAAVFAYEQHAKTLSGALQADALRKAIVAGLQYADQYPAHREVATVLTRTAESQHSLKAYAEAIATAARVLKPERNAPEALRRTAWSVTADAQFALQQYAEAETAYAEELKLTPAKSTERGRVAEQMSVAAYKQGEAARNGGDPREAARQFLRVAQSAPDADVRATAQYDAAAAFIQLQDWPNAIKVLETFRGQYPKHVLIAEVDKKLAVAYQADQKAAEAAEAFRRIAARSAETSETRREAAWIAASLVEQAKNGSEAIRQYEHYLKTYPTPVEKAMEARQRLAALNQQKGDAARQQHWLRDIIEADAAAGAERSDRTRLLAAQAGLELGRTAIAEVQAIRLTLPLEKSLPKKKAAMEKAIDTLNQAAGHGFAEVTPAATYELASLYRAFGKAVLDSERPKLSELELEQYNALLDEQAYPFEEKAISTYESNLKNARQGVYDDWIARSYDELLKLAPAKYGKHEKGSETYESLR